MHCPRGIYSQEWGRTGRGKYQIISENNGKYTEKKRYTEIREAVLGSFYLTGRERRKWPIS